jgi:hypothetical protein
VNWNLNYWVLNKYRMVTVNRDPLWLSTNLESMKSVWEEIQKHRELGTLPDHPKQKGTLIV